MLDIQEKELPLPSFFKGNTSFNNTSLVLAFLFLCRLISNYFIPLNDVTEARYGEMARKMLETGNWVTLLHDYGMPFWAKPPLSTWLSALSMQFFGINEFAARLPSLFLSISMLWLIWDVAKKHSGYAVANTSLLVLASTLFFFLDAGTVMTDPSLLFCITLSSTACWQALINKSRVYSYAFFIGLALGLLAKGPLIIVLVGLPIFFWILLRNQWLALWQNLPWIKGSILLCIIALPWYILAEIRTPGFLHYFIVGEHFNRFLVAGWPGDKYGIAHYAPKGMIWIYALIGLLPWSFLAIKWFFNHGKKLPSLLHDEDGWMSYWCLFLLTPLVFFTFANNIIYPYVFPALPAFALLFAEIRIRFSPSPTNNSWIFRCATLSGSLFLVATLLFIIKPSWIEKTQKPLIQAWINQHPKSTSNLIYWDNKTDFSAAFYSAGRAKSTQDPHVLCQWLINKVDNYLIINSQAIREIPKELFSKLTPITSIKVQNQKKMLVHFPVIKDCT